jgi:dynactin-5
VVIAIGKYCLLGEGCVIRPPYKTYKGCVRSRPATERNGTDKLFALSNDNFRVFSYYPMKVGDYVHIGTGTILEAASVGNMVEIGRNCVIGRFAIIKDCAKIADNTVIAPNTVVPSLSLFAGSPGCQTGELSESTPELIETRAKSFYARFQPE